MAIDSVETFTELLQLLPEYISDNVAIELDQGTRNSLSASSLQLSFDHHRSIAVLVSQAIYGSAFALARCQFESYVRALWMFSAAVEKELVAISKGERIKNRLKENGVKREKIFREYIEQISDPTPYLCESIRNHYDGMWKALNSYTHGGEHQLRRYFDGKRIRANFKTEEIDELARFSCIYAMKSIVLYARLGGVDEIYLNADRLAKIMSRLDSAKGSQIQINTET